MATIGRITVTLLACLMAAVAVGIGRDLIVMEPKGWPGIAGFFVIWLGIELIKWVVNHWWPFGKGRAA